MIGTALTAVAHLAAVVLAWAGATVFSPAYLMVIVLASYVGIHPMVHLLVIIPGLALLLLVVMPTAMAVMAVQATLKVRNRDALLPAAVTVTGTTALCTLLGVLYMGITVYKLTLETEPEEETAYLLRVALPVMAGLTAASGYAVFQNVMSRKGNSPDKFSKTAAEIEKQVAELLSV